MSLVIRRRAIYTGLARHIPEEELLPILSFWEANYAEKPAFALNEFLGEVAKRCSQKLERASLYRELISIMNGPSSALLPDPLPKMEGWRRGAGAGAAEVSGPDVLARQTFEALSSQLFAAIEPGQLPGFRRQVSGGVGSLSGDSELKLRVRAWLEQGGSLGRVKLDLEQLRALLTLLYAGLCELLGPVQADRVLARAVREVEAANPGMAPQRLL